MSDFELECRATWGFGDEWFSIERSDFRRISWEFIEGPAEDMIALAAALEAWTPFHSKRCALEIDGDRFWLSSPRNSVGRGAAFDREKAAGLAKSIRAEVEAAKGRERKDDDNDDEVA